MRYQSDFVRSIILFRDGIIPTRSVYLEDTPDERIFHYTGYYNHLIIPYSIDIADAIIRWL